MESEGEQKWEKSPAPDCNRSQQKGNPQFAWFSFPEKKGCMEACAKS